MNDIYDDKYVKRLITSIYKRLVNVKKLPKGLYLATADFIKGGVYEGYGITRNELVKQIKLGSEAWTKGDLELLNEFRDNVYIFSGAKTYQQVRALTDAVVSEEGVIKSFRQFETDAKEILTTYNRTYLETEYKTAIGQAQNGQKWQRITEQERLFPLLEYSAVLDSRTSQICRPLDGLIAPVNDPIWKKVAPCNHFNCRCLLKQLRDGELTSEKDKAARVAEVERSMQDAFKINPGKTGYIFGPDHPYFEVAAKDKALARNNFNLPIPKKDK